MQGFRTYERKEIRVGTQQFITLDLMLEVGTVFLMAVTVPTVQSSGDTHWNRMQDQAGGGVLNTTAKSGSNRFRGSAFFQNRPNGMIGPLFFNQIRDIENSPQFWRRAGGGIGGPLVHNKTFFWGAAERYRDGLSQNAVMTVPTLVLGVQFES